MKMLRALALLLLVAVGFTGAGTLSSSVAAAAETTYQAALNVPAEDAATQSRAFSEAYNLLLDHYLHPLDSAALLRAAWDQLAKEAGDKAVPPGPAPALTGQRAADLETTRGALVSYLSQPNSHPDGFIAAHALIRGMVRFVDEGHTYFLDQQQYRDYQSLSRGDNTYVGIGISINTRDAQPRIVEVYEDTPANQAGLQPGDALVQINGTPVAGLASDEITALVRGEPGTAVQLVVRRGDDPTLLTYRVERAEIHLQLVKNRTLDDIGYVALRGFPEPSVVNTIDQDVAAFQQSGLHGLVLDLRGNSGGRIDVGTQLLNHFLPAGSGIYEEVDRTGKNLTHVTRAAAQYGLPLVVLVDGGTASMGEIFASAVQEHGAATIVGSTTSGSVAAAQVFSLPDGSGIQVTVFDILSSEGKPLNKVGVQPDEVVETQPTLTQANDPVLTRAIEILHDNASRSNPSAQAPQQP